ncbi:hypothetical protein EJ06DRAFT_426822 [Trichodelitschia bisporula]|uniref:Uncharacterized protein n=1 Tax=Trichodelitschia bisporula TaxID=703511 RepID=A0A6G1HWM1_9PEZI|nr:hypothetical protein EJ06DRAFT_426822 [Trichodelitschia bisporula]
MVSIVYLTGMRLFARGGTCVTRTTLCPLLVSRFAYLRMRILGTASGSASGWDAEDEILDPLIASLACYLGVRGVITAGDTSGASVEHSAERTRSLDPQSIDSHCVLYFPAEMGHCPFQTPAPLATPSSSSTRPHSESRIAARPGGGQTMATPDGNW